MFSEKKRQDYSDRLLEKSYAKDADYFLTVEMGGNLENPLAPAAGS